MDTLSEIAVRTKTDKFGSHTYTPIYNTYFEKSRFDKLRILEIGYGGYGNPNAGGESARMWAEYFPNSEIIVTDIHDKIVTDEGYAFLQGDQVDPSFMSSLGAFDRIIDDGSHQSAHMISTFNLMFRLMNPGGIYVIEDTQCCYFKELVADQPATEYFKGLTDGLNHNEIRGKKDHSYLDLNIFSIHFYHNLIFIFKGDNSEPSNTVR